MMAFAKHHKIKGSLLTFFADPFGKVTRGLGMELKHPVVEEQLGLMGRCKRFGLLAVNGQVKLINMAFAQDDPAGADRPQNACAESLLSAIQDMKAASTGTEPAGSKKTKNSAPMEKAKERDDIPKEMAKVGDETPKEMVKEEDETPKEMTKLGDETSKEITKVGDAVPQEDKATP